MRGLAMVALLLFAGLTVGADSCTTTTTDEPDKGGSGGAGDKERSPKARLRDSITLKGADTKVKVTVLSVQDPADAGEFDEPEKGSRYVGVEIRLRNVGSTTYHDSPSNGAKLIGTGGQRADSTILSGGDCGGDFASDVTLSSGTDERGCIPFELKEGSKPKRFQFGLDSGFGPQTGEWSLK
jgi:hypothetical protein